MNKNYISLFLSLFSLKLGFGTLFFVLFKNFKEEFITAFIYSPIFNLAKLSIYFLSLALSIMSVSYLYRISSKSLFMHIESHRTKFFISKAICFLKDSFVVIIFSFFIFCL